MATGIGPWPSISQSSPGSALPRRRASRSTRTTVVQVGGRVMMSMASDDGLSGGSPGSGATGGGSGPARPALRPTDPAGPERWGKSEPARSRGADPGADPSGTGPSGTCPSRASRVTRAKKASAHRARWVIPSADAPAPAPAPPGPRSCPPALRRLCRHVAAWPRWSRILAPRSAVSRPWKQKAPSASVHEVKWRSAWILRTVARGSLPAEVARERRHRSFTTARGCSAAPARSSGSRAGSSTPAPHSSVSLAADSFPWRRTSEVPGSSSNRRPLARVPRA